MKASTALFASVVAICCTINLVTGQIHFADGTSQSTAYTGQAGENGYYIPGDAFHVFTTWFVNNYPVQVRRVRISDPVPAGQELVILQASSQINSLYLSSRLPEPDDGTNEIFLTYMQRASSGGYSRPNFPDGTMIVDEGRELWIDSCPWCGSGTIYDKLEDYFNSVLVLGYYRDKEPGGGTP